MNKQKKKKSLDEPPTLGEYRMWHRRLVPGEPAMKSIFKGYSHYCRTCEDCIDAIQSIIFLSMQQAMSPHSCQRITTLNPPTTTIPTMTSISFATALGSVELLHSENSWKNPWKNQSSLIWKCGVNSGKVPGCGTRRWKGQTSGKLWKGARAGVAGSGM
jgi:hypothetical protein